MSSIFWSGGCSAASPPVKEVESAFVFEATSDVEQGVGTRFRPAASCLYKSVSDDVVADTFHDAGSDQQSAFPVEVATHSARIGFVAGISSIQKWNAPRDALLPIFNRIKEREVGHNFILSFCLIPNSPISVSARSKHDGKIP